MALDRAVYQLRKYSWADDKSADGKSNYSHVVANNLCLILEGSADIGGRLILQVVQATKILDNINLAYHIDAANNTRRRFLEANRHVADRQLPTYAVSSGPKLAITHRHDDGKIHRMQVAMAQEGDCERIVALLKYRGMTFVEPSQSSAPRTRTASRPTTASTMLSRMIEPRRQESQAEINHFSPVPDLTPRFARDERQAPREMIAERPTTREMFRAPTLLSSRSQLPIPLAFDLADYSNKTPFHNPSSESLTALPDTTPLPRPDRLDRYETRDVAEQMQHPKQRNLYSSMSWSDSSLAERHQPMSMELPMHEEPRPQTQSSSTPSLPLLTKLGPTSQSAEQPAPSEKPVSRAGSSRGGRKKRKLDNVDTASTIDEIADDASSMPPPTARPRSSLSRSSPKNMTELLHGKAPRKTGAKAKQSPSTIEQVEIANTSLPQLSRDELVRMLDQTGLEEYAKLSVKDRDEMLQQFIISMLGNKAFEKLCEDVSVCWQKLALNI